MVVQYLEAIVDSKPIKPFKYSGFLVSDLKLDGDLIQLRGKKLGKDDPSCCPSIDAESTIKISKNGFIPQ
ncbi:hypothetical protein [uncultured Microbulbifer sp.]|uniref:hypothetical protein n=1 Tax=uncultured Microbulbifer sp. TaxID=348147 RepID=UPI00261189DF|nr:hypothetical protein [uncultured Microbulbifer sp.]